MDILEFAINMELEGSKYYTEQSENNKDNSLFIVFNKLAEDEAKHAEIIRNKKEDAKYSPKTSDSVSLDDIFADKAQKISDIKATPEQLDAYLFALEKEKESIALYNELFQKLEDDRELFKFLIAEEEKHFKLLSDIVALLSHPKDWVESAEFGVREDY